MVTDNGTLTISVITISKISKIFPIDSNRYQLMVTDNGTLTISVITMSFPKFFR